MKQIIILNQIPTLLNSLYRPTIRNGKLSIVKDKSAIEFINYVKLEATRQKIKLNENNRLSFKCDILIKSRKNYDIYAVLKLLLDSLEGIAYKNDRHIIDLRVRKHLKAEKDGIDIMIEDIND